MGIAADSLFNVMMSWVRALVSSLWALFSGDHTSALEFLGKNWMAIAAAIIICGRVIDWMVWLIRWQPYHLWARKLRKLLRLDEPDEEETPKKNRAHAAVMPEKRYARPQEMENTYRYNFDEFDEDEENEFGQEEEALIQEEARIRALKEQERLAREAYEAEQTRRAQEAYEAEQARRAQEVYEAEQARRAQEEYARQMEEYERQMAQYERDLAEYERQKAEYEAQMAAKEQEEAGQTMHRRRSAVRSHGADPIEATVRMAKTSQKRELTEGLRKPEAKEANPERRMENKADAKQDRNGNLLGRMAKMIEPEEEALISRKTLPPRVDMNDAFRTAKLPVVTPPKDGRRRKG